MAVDVVLNSPLSGSKRVDIVPNFLVEFYGTWSNEVAFGSYYGGTSRYTSVVGSSYRFKFNGDRISVCHFANSANTKIDFILDGVTYSRDIVNLGSNTVVFEKTGLSSGTHILEVIFKGPSGFMEVGSVDISTDSSIMSLVSDVQSPFFTFTDFPEKVKRNTAYPSTFINGSKYMKEDGTEGTINYSCYDVYESKDYTNSVEIISDVDYTKSGTYSVTFKATDMSGNVNTITKNIEVVPAFKFVFKGDVITDMLFLNNYYSNILVNNFTDYKNLLETLKTDIKIYKDDVECELVFSSFNKSIICSYDRSSKYVGMILETYNNYISFYYSSDSYFSFYTPQPLFYEGSEYGKLSVIEKAYNIKLISVDTITEGQEFQLLEYLVKYIFEHVQYLFDKYSAANVVIPSQGFQVFYFKLSSYDCYLDLFYDGSGDGLAVDIVKVVSIDISQFNDFFKSFFSYLIFYSSNQSSRELPSIRCGGFIITQKNITPVITGDNNSYYTKSEEDLKFADVNNQINVLKSLILNISDTGTGTVSNNIKIDEAQFTAIKEVLKSISISIVGGVK